MAKPLTHRHNPRAKRGLRVPYMAGRARHPRPKHAFPRATPAPGFPAHSRKAAPRRDRISTYGRFRGTAERLTRPMGEGAG